jgi:dihydroorotate dehydrogenase electron transfer subunit
LSGVCTWGRVASRGSLGSLVWLTVEVPGWPEATPGQFVMLRSSVSACFLSRPLSVADHAGEQVSFLIAPVGPGTRELCALGVGDGVWVVGPLGRGFVLEAMGWGGGSSGRLVLVGGGVGVAPFPLLLRRMATVATSMKGKVGEALVLVGFRDQEQAQAARPVAQALRSLEAAGVAARLQVTTEDGSLGTRGLVTDSLAKEIRPGDRLAVCGPPAMNEAVARVCASTPGVKAWFSLETFMACGLGACHGCVVTLHDGSPARVCREGPVFPGEALLGSGGEV